MNGIKFESIKFNSDQNLMFNQYQLTQKKFNQLKQNLLVDQFKQKLNFNPMKNDLSCLDEFKKCLKRANDDSSYDTKYEIPYGMSEDEMIKEMKKINNLYGEITELYKMTMNYYLDRLSS